MKRNAMCHDVAVSTSKHIVEVFRGVLREEELPDAFEEVYMRVRAALEFSLIEAERMSERLQPGRN